METHLDITDGIQYDNNSITRLISLNCKDTPNFTFDNDGKVVVVISETNEKIIPDTLSFEVFKPEDECNHSIPLNSKNWNDFTDYNKQYIVGEIPVIWYLHSRSDIKCINVKNALVELSGLKFFIHAYNSREIKKVDNDTTELIMHYDMVSSVCDYDIKILKAELNSITRGLYYDKSVLYAFVPKRVLYLIMDGLIKSEWFHFCAFPTWLDSDDDCFLSNMFSSAIFPFQTITSIGPVPFGNIPNVKNHKCSKWGGKRYDSFREFVEVLDDDLGEQWYRLTRKEQLYGIILEDKDWYNLSDGIPETAIWLLNLIKSKN